ncbi:MAG: protein kinase domain-containing protein, partial [Planctomycetota bacterium]
MACTECGTKAERDTVFCTNCGVLIEDHASVDLAEAPAERVFSDRYVLLTLLGRGGMGAVYLARDTQLDKLVALKVLPSEIVADLGAIDGMKEEVRIAQDLRHENIAAIYNFESDPQRQSAFIVMEFIDGADLHSLLARAPDERLPVTVVAHILKDCAGAIDYAHDKRIIHRDIKANNIMVARDGVVKATDFGIARRIRDTMSKVSQTVVAGTPAYMAPEHVEGHKIDNTTDIYSLGVMVFELLTGALPFEGSGLQLVYQILNRPPAPIDPAILQGNEEAAGKLTEVVHRAIAKKPEDRYQTATEFQKEFYAAIRLAEAPAREVLQKR